MSIDAALIEAALIECLQSIKTGRRTAAGGGVALRRAPRDRARLVVHDGREVPLSAAVGDLVFADRPQAIEAAVIEAVGC